MPLCLAKSVEPPRPRRSCTSAEARGEPGLPRSSPDPPARATRASGSGCLPPPPASRRRGTPRCGACPRSGPPGSRGRRSRAGVYFSFSFSFFFSSPSSSVDGLALLQDLGLGRLGGGLGRRDRRLLLARRVRDVDDDLLRVVHDRRRLRAAASSEMRRASPIASSVTSTGRCSGMLPGRHSISISRVTMSRMPPSVLTPLATPMISIGTLTRIFDVHQRRARSRCAAACATRGPAAAP